MKLVAIAVPIGTLEDETIDDLTVFVTLRTIRHGKIERTISDVLLGEGGPLASEIGFDITIAEDVVIARVVFQHKLTLALVEDGSLQICLTIGGISSSTSTRTNHIEIGDSLSRAT